jgi:hypothetical protein
VLLNFSDQDTQAEVALPEPFAAFGHQKLLSDLLSGEMIETAGTTPLTITMPAWGVKILNQA